MEVSQNAMAMACSSTEEGGRRYATCSTSSPGGVSPGLAGNRSMPPPRNTSPSTRPAGVPAGRMVTGTIARHMEDWKQAWPETETAVLPGAAHGSIWTRPRRSTACCWTFLTRCGGSRRGR